MIFIAIHTRVAASRRQVNAVSEHGQRGGLEHELAAVTVDVLRPAEGAFFKTFCHEPISSSIKVEDLDEAAGFVIEEEGRATEWIKTEVVACERDVDFEVAVEGEHGG